jgi:DNA ligase 1
MRRELLQLAEKLNVAKHRIGGHYISEKLDGTRCFWDGGISRGMRTENTPWSSILNPKTGKKKDKIKPIATGLWSRYGNPIIAPDWFLDTLPACLLDGELTAGRGKFQLTRSICGGDAPDPRFDQIKYAIYSAPGVSRAFQNGLIKNSNMLREVDSEACMSFITSQLEDFEGDFRFCAADTFQGELDFLSSVLESQTKQCYLLKQERLPLDEGSAHVRVAEFLDYVLEQGGEGVVLRDPEAEWQPKRHKGILKWKPYEDAEGTLTGFTSGRETDKGSKHLGKIGALILDYKGKRLELSGLTDEEREFAYYNDMQWASHNPGKDMPPDVQGKHFKVGDTVTFKYRELSDDGIPKEARYDRKRDVE